jgi:N-acetylglutamate synthase-like GNAT family acetyltransferase
MSSDQQTRTAGNDDLPFVLHLQRRFSNELGFVPAAGIACYLEMGCIQLATENDDAAGYVLCRPPSSRESHVAKIVQTAVSFDARRRAHGLALIDRACATAVTAGASIVQACVRWDLAANAFFAAAGFTAVALRSAPTARDQEHVVWRRPLVHVTPRVLRTIARPYRCQGPGGKFLPAADVARQFTFRRPTRRELLELLDVAQRAA